MGQIQSIDDLIGLLIRRRLLIGAISVFGIVLTLLYLIAKPDVFESTAVIQVQSPTVANEDGASSVAHEGSAQRLQTIQQQLTTRDNMLAVIARHSLYANLPLSDDEKVLLLRNSLRFETVASAATPEFGSPAEVSALLISTQGATRAQAARIANDFAQSILDAGAAGQTERTRDAASFFREEDARLKAAIAALAAEIATYQNNHRDALPAQRDVLRTELSGLEVELRTLDQALVAARNERATIERKTTLRATDRRQMDSLSADIETLAAQGTALEARRDEIQASLARSPDIDRSLSEYERSLAQLQSQLDVVTRRTAEAETAAKLQDRQQGETFTLLERAVEPDYPISGGRRKLAAAGVVASLLLGVLVAFVMDQLRPVIRTQPQLIRELDLRAIVAIPEIRHPRKSLRHTLMPDMPWLSGLSRQMPNFLATVSGNGTATKAELSRVQAILGGTLVVLLVAAAAAMT
jgi:tyrosine-protein kinase Etk/Wzc